jgi:hypothetical protein
MGLIAVAMSEISLYIASARCLAPADCFDPQGSDRTGGEKADFGRNRPLSLLNGPSGKAKVRKKHEGGKEFYVVLVGR